MRSVGLICSSQMTLVLLTLCTCSQVRAVSILGTTVTGTAILGGCNAFDNGAMSCFGADYLGSGTTAVIGTRTPTFSGSAGHDSDLAANLTASSLTITENAYEFAAPGIYLTPMTFTDTAFAGLGLEVASFTMFTSPSQFSVALAGDTISFSSPGVTPAGLYTLTVNLVSTPEPSTVTLILVTAVCVFTVLICSRIRLRRRT